MKPYSYFRSSASYRVRVALALKGLPYEYPAAHLLKGGGQQLSSVYRSLNPDSPVPTFENGPHVLTQSLAIVEYLNELLPEPPLLPSDAADRAYVRSAALQGACEIHPMNNLRVPCDAMHTLLIALRLRGSHRNPGHTVSIHEGMNVLVML